MHVEELMTKGVQSCVPEDSLERAAQLMWEHDCGSIPVCAGDANGPVRTVGMITDRDICMCALFQYKTLRELHVRDAMTKQLLSCRPGDTLDHAEEVMREARIRRLPVLDEQGALMGMICLADLAREAAREESKADKAIDMIQIGDTLAAICTPRSQPSAC